MIEIPAKLYESKYPLIELLKILNGVVLPEIEKEKDYRIIRNFLDEVIKDDIKETKPLLIDILTNKLYFMKGTLSIFNYINIPESRLTTLIANYSDDFKLNLIISSLETSGVTKSIEKLKDLLSFLLFFTDLNVLLEYIMVTYTFNVNSDKHYSKFIIHTTTAEYV